VVPTRLPVRQLHLHCKKVGPIVIIGLSFARRVDPDFFYVTQHQVDIHGRFIEFARNTPSSFLPIQLRSD
jgi:hypothetical protein